VIGLEPGASISGPGGIRIEAQNAPTEIEFDPLEDRVLIRPDAAKTESIAGVIIPEAAQEKPAMGEVLAVGPKAKYLEPGVRVLFAKYSGAEIDLNGELLLVVQEAEVLGIVRPKLVTA
jgi:chaperonin GroES